MAARIFTRKIPLAAIIGLSLVSIPALTHTPSKAPESVQPRMSVVLPSIDAKRGRKLFVTKGCFICHSVKGVGGKAAPALDATSTSRQIDVLGFVTRMWNGAPFMFQLQALELGYRIDMEPHEIADLAGFVGDAEAQKGFSLKEIPEIVQDWMVNEAWWENPSMKLDEKLPKKFPDLDSLETIKP